MTPDTFSMTIGGRDVAGAAEIDVINPATGKVFAHAPDCTAEQLDEAVAALGMVAEGVPNALSIHDAARKAGVRTPIIDAVYAILYQGKPTAVAMRELLDRDPRPECS